MLGRTEFRTLGIKTKELQLIYKVISFRFSTNQKCGRDFVLSFFLSFLFLFRGATVSRPRYVLLHYLKFFRTTLGALLSNMDVLRKYLFNHYTSVCHQVGSQFPLFVHWKLKTVNWCNFLDGTAVHSVGWAKID